MNDNYNDQAFRTSNEVNQVPIENKGRRPKSLIVLKIICAIIYLAMTAVLIYSYVDVANEADGLGKAVGLTLFLSLILFIYGGASTIVGIILSSIGLSLSIKNIKIGRATKLDVTTFAILIVYPFVLMLIMLILIL